MAKLAMVIGILIAFTGLYLSITNIYHVINPTPCPKTSTEVIAHHICGTPQLAIEYLAIAVVGSALGIFGFVKLARK